MTPAAVPAGFQLKFESAAASRSPTAIWFSARDVVPTGGAGNLSGSVYACAARAAMALSGDHHNLVGGAGASGVSRKVSSRGAESSESTGAWRLFNLRCVECWSSSHQPVGKNCGDVAASLPGVPLRTPCPLGARHAVPAAGQQLRVTGRTVPLQLAVITSRRPATWPPISFAIMKGSDGGHSSGVADSSKAVRKFHEDVDVSARSSRGDIRLYG